MGNIRLLAALAAALATVLISASGLGAQNVPEDMAMADSVVYRPAAAVDSSLVGTSIMSLLGSGKETVTVHQSKAMESALEKHIADNRTRHMSGYRVRIFFDNSQKARQESEETLRRFEAGHPGVAAYRSYQNPYFKVTVGDFRTKSEALELLEKIRAEFPTAFILKENINYPVVDKNNAYVTDTVRVAKKIWQER